MLENKNEITLEENIDIIQKETDYLRKRKEPTMGEKIDYIYRTLKAEKRNARIKFFTKITIFAVIFYFIFFYIPSIPQKVVDSFTSEISDIIGSGIGTFLKPVIQDFTLDMLKDIDFSRDGTSSQLKLDDMERIFSILEQYPEIMEKLEANNNNNN